MKVSKKSVCGNFLARTSLKCLKDRALRQRMLIAVKEPERCNYDLSAFRQLDLPQADDFSIKMNDEVARYLR